MRLQFKVQQYQTDAVDAVVEAFAGQPKHDGISYRIDPGKQKPTAGPTLFETETTPDAGLRNAKIALSPKQLLENVHDVQRSRNLPLSSELEGSKSAPDATSKDNRRIYDVLDKFQSRRPIDVIRANRPVVIIDEPQKVSAPKSLEALSRFNALMTLRYSATHKIEHTKVHRLDIGANLHDVSGGIEAYKDLFVTDIDANRDEVQDVHQGYFSVDKKTKRAVDGTVHKSGDEKGQSKDVDAYDLILKDKEGLLSFSRPNSHDAPSRRS